ncbi:MAG: hypothetical protein OXM55_04380 [Bdellovibrionales bacterium]|nr:hypothetical protein [Bdellovibrionales bacterium]
MQLKAVREIKKIHFKETDTLVIFGEVFPGGYVSGLIRSAQSKGMKVIYSTVGRRDSDGKLRQLNAQELESQPSPLINIPLEAGFDMEPSHSGQRPIDLCQEIKLSQWDQTTLDKNVIEDSKKRAILSFQNRTKQWLKELTALLPDKGNVLIAHTMAGGVPRTKILLPILNRVLKGVGKRFFSSEVFWKSDMGWFCENNFNEVTAQTYKHLIELSTPLREQLNKQNRQIFYTAYSYHGTEVLIENQYQWQTYSPYLQGFAKMELENISSDFSRKGLNTCVFNVPEILTKSSAVFPGVEIPLYTILGALKKDGGEDGQKIVSHCLKQMTKDAFNIITETTKNYFESEEVKKQSVFEKWPQHNSTAQMEKMLNISKKLSSLHKDTSQSITPFLSETLFNSCGNLILQEIAQTKQAVCWLGHDVIASDIRDRERYL